MAEGHVLQASGGRGRERQGCVGHAGEGWQGSAGGSGWEGAVTVYLAWSCLVLLYMLKCNTLGLPSPWYVYSRGPGARLLQV